MKMEEFELGIERIGIGVHLAVTDGTFAVRAVIILCEVGIFGFLVQFKILVDEVAIKDDKRDYLIAFG